MKKNIFSWLFLFILVFLGCTKEDVPEVEKNNYFIAVTKSETFNAVTFCDRLGAGASIDPSLLPNSDICVKAIRYLSEDPRGNQVEASGIISYPLEGDIRGVIVGEHATITSLSEAPSAQMVTIESALSLFGYVVISPDYLGFGATSDLPHPYLHVESAGRNSVDMVFAAREYMASIHRPIETPVSVIGYSQGGAVALSFQKMAEKQYAADIPVKRVMAGGGPYDLVEFYNTIIKTDYVGFPASVPLTILGLDYGDNLELDYSKVFQEALLVNYKDWILSKKYTSGKINQYIGTYQATGFVHPDMFKEEMNEEFRKLYLSLKKNSLIDWMPRAPIVLVHGEYDRYVPYVNAQNAYDSFVSKGCKVELIPVKSDHVGTAVNFYLQVLKQFAL